MRRRRSPGNPSDRPGLKLEEATYGCVSERECTLTVCRMNVSTLGVFSQKKTDPVEVTRGPDPGDKADAWKGVRTTDCSNRLWTWELGRAPVPPCITRVPKGKAMGSAALKLGPQRLGPDSVYLGPPKSEKRKKKKKQNLV